MLDGVITGYEELFDFPERATPPERPWLLASVPRSGSTFVSHLLWATGCLGAPLEYLNFEPTGPYGFASGSAMAQAELWTAVQRRRTSPNGVFGLKAFPGQLEEVYRSNPRLMADVMRLLFPPARRGLVVQLRRRDSTAHAVSYARATLSGIWRKEQETEDRPEPEYSHIALQRAERMIAVQEEAWQAMYRDLRIEPLTLWYEDVLADPQKAVTDVAAHLGVEIDPLAAIPVPQVERQSQEGAAEWKKRHAGR